MLLIFGYIQTTKRPCGRTKGFVSGEWLPLCLLPEANTRARIALFEHQWTLPTKIGQVSFVVNRYIREISVKLDIKCSKTLVYVPFCLEKQNDQEDSACCDYFYHYWRESRTC